MSRSKSRRLKRVSRKCCDHNPSLGFEPLEKREMLSSIVWTNRGGAGNDSDLFGAAFGAQAAAARLVVDAAIDNWERIIPNFNTVAANGVPANTINVSFTMEELFGQTLGSAIVQTVDNSGRPRQGSITLDINGSQNNDPGILGWFVDPTPNDNSEFLANLSQGGGTYDANAGVATGGGPADSKADLFFVASHELFHVLGLNFHPSLLLNTTPGLVDNTGILDGNGPATLRSFNGASMQMGLTNANGTSQNPPANPVHMANSLQVIPADTQFPNGLRGGGGIGINGGGQSIRKLPSLVDSLFLRDAYGYTTVDPEAFGNFYSVLNSTTKELTVRGQFGNLLQDQIRITESNGIITTSVDRSSDLFPNFTPIDAFVTNYPAGSVSRITVLGTDADSIVVGRGVSVPVTVVGGAGNFNSLSLEGNDFAETFTVNANTISAINSGSGTGGSTITYSDISTIAVRGFGGADTFDFNTAPVNGVTLFGGLGNDSFNISPTARNLSNATGPFLSIRGDEGVDTAVLDDRNETVSRTFDITSTRVSRNGSQLTEYNALENLSLNSGQAADIFNIQTTPVGNTLVANGFGGDDQFNIGLNNDMSGILGVLSLIGGSNVDSFRLNDQAAATANNYTVFNDRIERSNASSIFYDIGNITLQAPNQPTTIGVESTDATGFYELIGNGGVDNFVVSPTAQSFSALFPELSSGNVLFRGGAGIDSLVVNDQTRASGNRYTGFGSGIFVGANTTNAAVRWDSTESVTFNAGVGNDVFNVEGGGGATIPTIVNGGLGNDTFNVTPNVRNFDFIFGLFTLNGGVGVDNLFVFDTARTTLTNVVFTDTSITRPGTTLPALTLSSLESLRFDVGTGNNTLNASAATIPVTFLGSSGQDNLTGGSNNDTLIGLAGNDTLAGNNGNDFLSGGSGIDSLNGSAGNDDLFGGDDADALNGGLGDDRLFGEGGNDTLNGGGGVDLLDEGPGQGGIVVKGTPGNDFILVGRTVINGVTQVISTINGLTTFEPYRNGETIIVLAGEGNDVVVLDASAWNNWQAIFHGGAGNDSLHGGFMNDQLYGESGNDWLFGLSGDDILVGGDGNDWLYGHAGRDLMIGGRGQDWLFGGQDDDLAIGGSTAHDANDQALLGLVAEWSSDNSYANRASRLGAGPGVRLQNGTTAFDDGERDYLYGETGRDLFFADLVDSLWDRGVDEFAI